MWLLYTSIPTSNMEAKTWDNSIGNVPVVNQGTTTDDRWWWAFEEKSDLESAWKKLKDNNQNNGMKLYRRNVDRIPVGWD